LTFISLCETIDKGAQKKNYQSELFLDCANGVGGKVIQELKELAGFDEKLKIILKNIDKDPTNLNEGCGAEFVQKD